ncbi:glycosyltransferase family 4 protein [Bacteroides sp. AN502(2024)]|uniref:glycosyltransferase family 4 protein n=1 Tax=Bacteroides sp. AN502(2024) TaxID=3160599 RepID=UPI00351743AF
MKIVYIINQLNLFGGVERIIADKANALAEEYGHEVTIICLCQKEGVGNAYPCSPLVKQINLGLEKFEFPALPREKPFMYIYAILRWYYRCLHRVRTVLRGIKPDITIVPTQVGRPGVYFRTYSIIESHMYFPKKKLRWRHVLNWGPLEYATRRCKALITLTHHEVSHWDKARRVEVIPNFTNIKPIAPCNVGAKRAMAAGRLTDQKGFDLLIDAWRIVKQQHPDWQLDIYGEGSEKNRLMQQIETNELADAVLLHQPTKEIAREYAVHSMFILSSRSEGFPLVLLEAITCGMPCVAFDCPTGPAEMIDHEMNGILVPFENLPREEQVSGLAAAICRMMEKTDEERAQMGKAAMEKAKLFGKDVIMARWDKLFHEVAGK